MSGSKSAGQNHNTQSTSPQKRILYIEDENLIRKTLLAALGRSGYEVTGAENGEEGLQIFQSHKPDLVMVDLKMPGINGVQTFREVQKIDPKAVVIMMTAYSVEDLVKEALEEAS